MSVKVHEAYSLDSSQHRLLWWDDFLGDQIQDEWRTSGASVAVVDQQTGGIVRLTTGAVNGNTAFIDWSNIRSLLVSKKVSIEFRVKLTQTNAVNLLLQLNFDATDRIYFRYDTDAPDTNWILVVRDGGGITTGDSGVLPDTSYHIFRIECFPTGEVHFYIDGVECANSPVTANITALHLQPKPYLQTREDVAKSADIDYVVVRQEI